MENFISYDTLNEMMWTAGIQMKFTAMVTYSFHMTHCNTRESLGELKTAVETFHQQCTTCVSTAFLVLPNFHLCFYHKLYGSTQSIIILFLNWNIHSNHSQLQSIVYLYKQYSTGNWVNFLLSQSWRKLLLYMPWVTLYMHVCGLSCWELLAASFCLQMHYIGLSKNILCSHECAMKFTKQALFVCSKRGWVTL